MNDFLNVWDYKELIFSKIKISEVAKDYGLSLQEKEAGDFTHVTHCPFHSGKGTGTKERTPSLFCSDKTNSFYCFGCTKSGSLIDFVATLDSSPPLIALTKLAKKVGLVDKDGHFDEFKISEYKVINKEYKDIAEPLMEISLSIRDFINKYKNNDKALKWIDSACKKIDEKINQSEDYDYLVSLSEKVKQKLNNGEDQSTTTPQGARLVKAAVDQTTNRS